MAALRDIPFVIRKLGPFGFPKRIVHDVFEDNLFTWASALAYSWLFAVFPFFLFLLALLPLMPESYKESAKHSIAVAIYQPLPKEAANTLWDYVYPRLDEVLKKPFGGLFKLGVIISIGVTLFAASGGINATMSALDRCYGVQRARPFYKQRPLAVGLTAVVTTLILLVLVLLPIGSFVTDYAVKKLADSRFQAYLPLVAVWEVARYLLALLALFATLGIMYHFGPNVKGRKWRWITPGSVFCVIVWIVLGLAFRTYVDKFGNYNKTYGAVGGVAILLLLFYIDALVLLVGAEINSIVDEVKLGAPVGVVQAADIPPPPPETAVPEAEEVQVIDKGKRLPTA